MCDFRLIVKDRYGFVSYCQEYRYLEIGFGTSLIAFHYNHLQHFMAYLTEVKAGHTSPAAGGKYIILNVALTELLQMIVSYDELTHLFTMVEKASLFIFSFYVN